MSRRVSQEEDDQWRRQGRDPAPSPNLDEEDEEDYPDLEELMAGAVNNEDEYMPGNLVDEGPWSTQASKDNRHPTHVPMEDETVYVVPEVWFLRQLHIEVGDNTGLNRSIHIANGTLAPGTDGTIANLEVQLIDSTTSSSWFVSCSIQNGKLQYPSFNMGATRAGRMSITVGMPHAVETVLLETAGMLVKLTDAESWGDLEAMLPNRDAKERLADADAPFMATYSELFDESV
jgi:hypothetical protein